LNPSPDPASEIVRLRRRARLWAWVAVIGVAVTIIGFICSRDPAWHVASSAPASAPYPAPTEQAAPYSPPPTEAAPSPSPPAEQSASPDGDFTNFSLAVVRQHFASACPNAEVVPLPCPEAVDSRLADRDCPRTAFAFIYAPDPEPKTSTLIAWGVIGPGESGSGTRLHLTWNCAITVPPGSPDGHVPLTLELVGYDPPGGRSEQQIPVLTAAQLSSSLCP
jgi:hypothetical protein